MDQEEVERLLYGAALSEAVALGFRFGHRADDDMRERARSAAQQIFERVRTPEQLDSDIENAVRVFRLVVDTMVGARQEAYANDPQRLQGKIIGEETFQAMLDKLCPGLFPFC